MLVNIAEIADLCFGYSTIGGYHMKNRRLISLVILALIFAMLMPTLASCTKEAEYEEEAATVYTIYSIKSDDTTDDAIRAVELAINRIIFYRLGICVKLMLYTEDEYEAAIEAKFAEIEAYEAKKEEDKKNNKNNTSSEPSESSEEVSEDILTGEKILENLEKGIDTELETPRLDIFLVRGFDTYSKLAGEKKLAALDEKLSSEAKLIKDYVHPYFFQAAKYSGKTYGVPCNTSIGQYRYIVFDKELLSKYQFDAQTMSSVSDLQEYLALIKENEPDIIPLQTATDSSDYSFMFENGFATYVDSTGHVLSSYEDSGLLSYLAMIARYNALGYFSNSEGKTAETDPDTRFAVSFVDGNELDIEALEKETGREYEYNVYQVPTATNENTIDSLLCVSSYCVSNELDDVAKLLSMLYTDEDLQNLLAHGVENEHYMLDDNDQVVRLTTIDGDRYSVDRLYAGNQFISTTLAGEDKTVWEKAKAQNRDAVISNTLGFSVQQSSFTYKDENKVKITVYEPDYCKILSEVIEKYYPTLMQGKSVDFNIEEFTSIATETVYQNIRQTLTDEYATKLQTEKSAQIAADFGTTAEAKELYQTAYDTIMASIKKAAKRQLKNKFINELTEKYKKEGVEKTSAEISAEAEAMITDELIEENKFSTYTEEQFNDLVNAQYNQQVTKKVNALVNEYLDSDEYKKALTDYAATAEFEAEVESRFAKSGKEEVDTAIDNNIAEKIAEISAEIIAEFNTEIEKAINEFVETYLDVLVSSGDSSYEGFTKEKLLTEIGYYTEEYETDDEGNTVEGSEPTYTAKYDSYFEFVWQGKIKTQYYKAYGDPDAANG